MTYTCARRKLKARLTPLIQTVFFRLRQHWCYTRWCGSSVAQTRALRVYLEARRERERGRARHKARVRVKKERASVWREGTRLRTACIRSRGGASGSASGGRCPGNAAYSSCQRGWRLAASLAFPSAPLWFLLSAGPGCATDIRAVWPEKGCLHTTPLLLQRCLRCSRCSALARERPRGFFTPAKTLRRLFVNGRLRCGLFGTTF